MYRSWLRESPDPARIDEVFAELFRLEPDLLDLLELSSTKGIGPEPLLALSRLAEMSGRLEEARTLAERARESGAGIEGTVTAAFLALEMNDTQAAAVALEPLRVRGDGWAEVIDGYRDLAAERWDLSRGKLGRAAEAAADARVALVALWGVYECARRSADAEGAAAAAAAISGRFPGSPEEALATGRASLVASPALFTAPSRADSFSAQEAPAAAPMPAPKAGGFSVQVGSFQVRENADELAAELAKKGFSPVVREETRQGKTLSKLYAGVDMERAQALSLAESLRRAGYAGFLIAEAR